MKRLAILSVMVMLALAVTHEASGQQTPAPAAPKAGEAKKAEPARPAGGKSKEAKIQSAMSAAPKAIAKDATILDLPSMEGGQPTVLRQGKNEWTCLPDDPATPGNDPMCLDKNGMVWAQAWMSKQEPKLSGPGLGYMLLGGSDASNKDPFAKKPAQGDKWVKSPPHLMVFPTGKLDPAAYGTDYQTGRPWIMWSGTPYEHLMIPVK